ncbi:toxin-antitoxin system YwqK family antitoxin [Flavobacterium flavipallidum]|uniref:Antitoxin component YwqK of YwqJK toxin-antitoxin module n=1 Tax=Flavobacterium flavipallidum TaxID=3139140 RepID=A0ABU9HKL0_9FLAO
MKIIEKISLIVFLCICVCSLQAQNDFNKVDAGGKKDGLWRGFYPESKRVRYEGTFSHGKEVGEFKFFDDTKAGTVIATRTFNTNDNVAYTVFYDQNKNKVSEGKVVNKLFEGEWKYYHHASTVVMTIENYKNGKLEGLRSVFFPSGKIAEETYYKNNLKNGSSKKYSEKGYVLEEATFKDNQYDGLAIFRDVDNMIVSKGKFVNGKKTGVWQFFENGKLTDEVNVNNPQPKKTLKSK